MENERGGRWELQRVVETAENRNSDGNEGKHASCTPESRDKEESNNITAVLICCPNIIFIFIHNIIYNETINES